MAEIERKEYPELTDAELEAIVAKWTPEQLAQVAFDLRAQFARDNFGPKGFADFYWCIWKRELPRHAVKWVTDLFDAYEAEEGLLLKASRGLTKSTTLITFAIYSMSHRPEGSGVIIQASDPTANKSSALMAATIEFNGGYKRVFPTVLPDKSRAWGAQGYHLRDARYPKPDDGWTGELLGSYDDWVAKTTQDHLRDPSFVAVGIGSSDAVGMHPSNFLLLDDIHDEDNTRSAAERASVKSKLRANVLPVTIRAGDKPMICVAYTPWDPDDGYAMLEGWEGFKHITTPGYTLAGEGDADAVWWDKKAAWIRLTFPEALGIKQLNFFWQLGERDFARSIMCDLGMAGGIVLKTEWVHRFPYERISPDWPVYIGVDYASTSDDTANRDRTNEERDYFALCWMRLSPSGSLILQDGIRDHLSQGAAEQKVYATALAFPTLAQITVEAIGKGEEFYNLLFSRAGLPLFPVRSHGGRSKGFRFEKSMAPMFQFSRIMVSDYTTPFIATFLDEWAGWGGASAITDDCLDSAYLAAFGARYFLVLPTTDDENPFSRKARQANPWANLSQ